MSSWVAAAISFGTGGVGLASLGACGKVTTMPDSATGTADDGPAVTYQGMVANVTPVGFGGLPDCTYTITLQMLSIELAIKPSGNVTSGEVHHHNVEQVVVTTPPCPYAPAKPTDSSYVLQSSQLATGSTDLTFTGDPGNAPKANLEIKLVPSPPAAYNAMLTVQRTDLAPPLAWTVTTTVALTPKAP